MGDGRAEGSSEGDGGHTAVSLTPYADGTHIGIFESLQLEVSNVKICIYCVDGSSDCAIYAQSFLEIP